MNDKESDDKTESKSEILLEETPMSKNAKKKLLKRKRLEEKWEKIKKLKKEEKEKKQLEMKEKVEIKSTGII